MSLWFEHLASLQRPDSPDAGDGWSSDAGFTELAASVPCQYEFDQSRAKGPTDVRTWIVFLQSDGAQAPKSRDRVLVSEHVFDAINVERFAWPDGTYSHHELRCSEVVGA